MGEEKIKFTSDVTHRCSYGSVDLTHCVLNKRCCCCERFNFSLFSLGFAALLQKGIESADFRQFSYMQHLTIQATVSPVPSLISIALIPRCSFSVTNKSEQGLMLFPRKFICVRFPKNTALIKNIKALCMQSVQSFADDKGLSRAMSVSLADDCPKQTRLPLKPTKVKRRWESSNASFRNLVPRVSLCAIMIAQYHHVLLKNVSNANSHRKIS